MTPGTRRLLSACLFALIVAAPIAALSPSGQAPTWPADRPTREHQEGDAITILFRASNHQDGVTSYSASNLPTGLSINAATGLVSGTLTTSTADQLNGAAGVRQVTITATNAGGSTPYEFTWKVSRFRKGDVFAGIGLGRYQVFSETGTYKYTLQSETEAEWLASGEGGAGTTTGCGFNWVSRKMYFTAFDVDHDPQVIEIDTVPASSGEAFPRNRISTFRDSGLEKGEPASGRSVDNAPESVVFDSQGNMYVSHAGGYYNADWMPADSSENPIVADSGDGFNYIYIDAAGNPLLSGGNPVVYPQGYSRSGVLERWPGEAFAGSPVALMQWGRDLQKFTYDGTTRTMSRSAIFEPHAGWQGTDWMDLASDQKTIYYTSEWGVIYKFDVSASPAGGIRQLTDYATLPARDGRSETLYALRLLPPGDGTGGLLVATPIELLRLSADNRVVTRYDAPGVDGWFALNISPDGRSLWSASTNNRRIYKWDISSGRLLPLGPSDSLLGIETNAPVALTDDSGNPTRYSLDGLCIMGEYTAAQELCGNSIDDDGDGEIDEICQPIEVCSNDSPGDDDGDGLVDSNDPDCGAASICTAGGYTDQSVAGFCARHNYEGDTVLLNPAPGPTDPALRETYVVTGSPSLPPGITFNANAVATGSPLYTTLLNTDAPNTRLYRITVQVRRERVADGSLVSNYTHRFDWTIENRNRPPVATSHTRTIRPGAAVSVDVIAADPSGQGTAAADSDPDTEDTFTITSNTTPSNGTLSRVGTTFTYTANTGFVGTDSYTYTISDGHGGTATATVTIHVVNAPPVARADAETTRPGRPVAISVVVNDSDPDGDALTIQTNTAPARGTLSRTGNVFTYTSSMTAPVFTGVDEFDYTVTDPYGATATARVRITVINTPPVAVNDAATTRPGQAVPISVLANDSDADAPPTPASPDTLTIISNTNPQHGQATCSASACTYTSTAGYVGPDNFAYTISDGYGGTSIARVDITVVNSPPVAIDDAATTIAPSPTAPIAVRANDPADPDGDTLTMTFTQPANGTVTRSGDTFVYTPTGAFVGVDTFTYTLADGYGGTDTATVTVTVTNRPPIAVNDTAIANGTVPVAISVMSNDGDPDNHVISIAGATNPTNGTITINANGTITYTANAGFEGTDFFFYTIRDGFGGESTARVTINVRPPNRFDPCICSQAKASPGELWPPNHKKTEVVNVTNLVDPASGQPLSIRILGIYQDEPTNYLGDGDTTIDGGGVGTSTAWVRAERTGNPNVPGNGRVYEIVFEASAPDGSSCQGSIFTGVPHDQGQGQSIIDDGIRYDSTVAGGPIVRNALKIDRNLTDAQVADAGFTPKYVAQARIGGSSVSELQVGPSLASPADQDQFTWTSGESVVFALRRRGDEVEVQLATGSRDADVEFEVDCANGECDDVFLRAQAGGTGKITLSSLNLNGIPLNETLVIDVGGAARSLRLSGLMLGSGMTLSGLAKLEWTSPVPAASALNFQVLVGKACPSDAGTGGGGGTGTPPLARADEYSTDEDTPLTVGAPGVLTNDLTFGGPLTAAIESSTGNGSLTLNPNGSFAYTPNPNFNGADTFRYRVSDGTLQSQPAVVTITVRPATDLPIAVNDSATTDERVPVSIPVLVNDSDPAGGTLAIVSAASPSNGTAAVSGTSIVYTPANGFVGTDTFTYTMSGAEGTASATVTVVVRNVNEPPVAVNDAYTTAEDTPLSVSAPGLKNNDSDPDAGDTLDASLVSQPQNGSVTLSANGSFVYTPSADYSGQDSFTYRVRDSGGLDSNVATVTITITAVNDPPRAEDDSYVVAEDSALQINAPGVKSNDTDPDTAASGLTISLVTGVQRGTLTLNADGSFLYTPLPNVSGADSFVYRISDGTGSDTATATIAITESPDPPQAVDDAATTPEDTPVTINVVANDTDSDSGTLTVQSFTPPANGTASIVGNQIRYVPNANFHGTDQFSYTITDGSSTATANVRVTVTSANDPPTGVADAYSTQRNTVLNVQAPGVLGNDTDPDQGQNLSASVVSQPGNGSVVLQSQGAFSYTPSNGFTGTDTFTYRVSDGTAFSAPVTVTITVTAANRPPVAVNDSYTADKGVALTVAAPGILGNDSDPDNGDTITASLISAPAANTGTLTLNSNGSFTFMPASAFTGTTTFRYRARDNHNADSSEAIVTIEVKDTATSGQVCYDGGTGMTQYRATLDWNRLENGDIKVRATVSRNYADNTYGINKIGWGNKKRDFPAVYRSDYGQLAFFDANDRRQLEFKIDYLSPLSGTPSGYGSLGVTGGRNGDGGMISGSAANIVSMATSMDLNMNAFGYVSTASNHPLKIYSPPTNASYTANAQYPLWIWDMWYEATVKASTFGSAGFGYPRLTSLHASPAKAEVTWRMINCQ